jgi:hypothetical protein
MTRIGKEFRPVVKNGRTVLVKKAKRYDVSTELKRATSKKVRVAKRGRP